MIKKIIKFIKEFFFKKKDKDKEDDDIYPLY